MKKNSLELAYIYSKVGFEKFSVGNPRTPALYAVFRKEIIVKQPCQRAPHPIWKITYS